jgi:cell division protein FtsQ
MSRPQQRAPDSGALDGAVPDTGTPGSAAPGSAPAGSAPAGGAPAGGAPDSGGVPGHKGDPWKTAFFGVMTAAIVAGVAWALLGSSLLVVRSVDAAGTPLVSRSTIVGAAGIPLGTPLIRINTAEVARRVEQIAQIQSARVTRDWPDKVTIVVQDRTPALAVVAGGRFALVDKFGVVVRWVARRPPRMPLLLDPPAGSVARLRGNAAVRAAVTVLQQVPASLRSKIKSVRAPAANAVELDLRGRITVLWGGTDRPGAKAAELAALMRRHASGYDVSDPGAAATSG